MSTLCEIRGAVDSVERSTRGDVWPDARGVVVERAHTSARKSGGRLQICCGFTGSQAHRPRKLLSERDQPVSGYVETLAGVL